jgi:non-homologous end joining protein Ku
MLPSPRPASKPPKPSTRLILCLPEEAPWTFFENAYYVEPAKLGSRAHALFRAAVKQTGRGGNLAGVDSSVMRGSVR